MDGFGGVLGGSSIYVMVCGGHCGGCAGHWEVVWCAALGIPGGMVGAVSVSVAFCLGFLVGAGDVASGGCVMGGCLG